MWATSRRSSSAWPAFGADGRRSVSHVGARVELQAAPRWPCRREPDQPASLGGSERASLAHLGGEVGKALGRAIREGDDERPSDGCPGMMTGDGYPGVYSYDAVDTSPDAVTGPGASLRAASSLAPCPARRGAITFRLRRFRGRPITLVRVYVGRRRVMTLRGRSLRVVLLAGLPGAGRYRLRVFEYTRRGFARRVTRTVRGCSR
jgi:hypothetical protein